jgi:hypothetical protein
VRITKVKREGGEGERERKIDRHREWVKGGEWRE